jgi:hypothetical protein
MAEREKQRMEEKYLIHLQEEQQKSESEEDLEQGRHEQEEEKIEEQK